jgi:sugar phosphate isomerase/epimerase
MAKDPRGTLHELATWGYDNVETFGYGNRKWFGFTASEFKKVLINEGLRSPSGHVFSGSIFLQKGWEDNWKIAVEDAKSIGQQYLVIPWLEEQHRKPENFKRIAEGLNKAGEICKQSKLNLAYHNHDFEFETVNGVSGFETLMTGTDPKLVCFELDIYWAVKANQDPIALFQKYPKRFPLWHLKDMDKTEKKFFTEVGSGIIDFKAIFRNWKQSGEKFFFVEQDECPGPPIESLKKSISYLEHNLLR